MSYYDLKAELIVLAELDESEAYEVDYTLIGVNKEGKFVLVTASGCSCWDGECNVEIFDNLLELEKSMGVFGKDREFQPSLQGAEKALVEAKKNLQFFPRSVV